MDQAPPRARCSRSGNTSGTRSFGTLASSATRCKTCAQARYPSGYPRLSSVHLPSPVSNVAMDQSPPRARSSRSGNTSGAGSPELLRVPLHDAKRVLVHGIRPVNPAFLQFISFPRLECGYGFRHRHRREVAEVATLRAPGVSELLRVPLHDAKRVLKHGIRPVTPAFLQFISLPPSRMWQWISHRHGREVAEVATLRAQGVRNSCEFRYMMQNVCSYTVSVRSTPPFFSSSPFPVSNAAMGSGTATGEK